MRHMGERIESIDVFRGLAILTMVIANYMGSVSAVTPWLKHAQDIGLTVIDLIAPFFIFAIGLTYGLSFRKRLENQGMVKTIQHFFTRYMALIGIGFLLRLAENWFDGDANGINWGVLQAIGVAGLLTLPTLKLPPYARLALAGGLLLSYQLLLDHYWLDAVLMSPHGGFLGSFAWAAMLMITTVMGDMFLEREKPKSFLLTTAIILGLGLAVMFISPISKHRVSASYILVATGISGLIFYSVHLLETRAGIHLPVLGSWGKNALLLYIVHYFVLALFVVPPIPAWYIDAPPWLVILQIIGIVAIMTGISTLLDKKQIYISL